MKVAIVGAGSWGTALAHALARDGAREVGLWARDASVAEVIARTRYNPSYLTDLALDDRVVVTADLAATLEGARIVILTVPTDAMRQVVAKLRSVLPADAVLVSAAKGFDAEGDLTMTAVLGEILGPDAQGRIVALSGPNIAVEIARGLPAATVVAGDEALGERGARRVHRALPACVQHDGLHRRRIRGRVEEHRGNRRRRV